MKKKFFVLLATAAAFIAVLVAHASAASACIHGWHDPEPPQSLK